MNKRATLILLALLPYLGISQEEMQATWSLELAHKTVHTGTGLEGAVSYAASEKDMTVFNNDDGKIVWSKPFSDMAPRLKKIDALIPLWDSRTVFLFDKRTGKDVIACVDLDKGETLWTSENYKNLTSESVNYISELDGFALSLKDRLIFIDARTGEEKWETTVFKGAVGKYVYNAGDNSMVMMNFMPGYLGALFTGFKNQIIKINMANGNIFWEQNYIGRAEQKMNSLRLKGYREFLFDLSVEEGKVFLSLNGLQVYDYESGKPLYSAAFDFTPDGKLSYNRGGASNSQILQTYGTVADPLAVGDDLYVVDMSQGKKQYIKKYNIHTGELLWTSGEIKSAKAIPNIELIDGVIVAQIGGMCEQHMYTKTTDPANPRAYSENWTIRYKNIKPNGLQAFDATTGKLMWDSERFKKGVTNMLTEEGQLIVCSGKSIYNIAYKTGDVNMEEPVNKDGIGLATGILKHKDNIVVVGEKGIALKDPTSGKTKSSKKYKTAELMAVVGDILIMDADKGDYAAYNLNDCSLRTFKGKKGTTASLSQEAGKYVYVYEKKMVSKFKTH